MDGCRHSGASNARSPGKIMLVDNYVPCRYDIGSLPCSINPQEFDLVYRWSYA